MFPWFRDMRLLGAGPVKHYSWRLQMDLYVKCHLITKLPFSSANASISMQGVSSVCEPRLRLCICMWALCLPICCAVTGEEIIRSSTGTNNHRLWGSDSAAGAGETRQQSTQREWRMEEEIRQPHIQHIQHTTQQWKSHLISKYNVSVSKQVVSQSIW